MRAEASEALPRFAHVNLVARDWRRLAAFYQDVFACVPVLPERDLAGEWLDRATGVTGARVRGIHLRLPGFAKSTPTLEIFEYASPGDDMPRTVNRPGFAHIAFAVGDVEAVARSIVERGGSVVGALTQRAIPGSGTITFQYVADPEGNVIELQRWSEGS